MQPVSGGNSTESWGISLGDFENTLHLLSLAGGWPGALVAQHKLRHKSRKQSFRLVFRATVVLNTGYYVWLYTPDGTAALRALMDSIA